MTTATAPHARSAHRVDPSWVLAAAIGAVLAFATFLVPIAGLALSTGSDQPGPVLPSPSPQAAPTPPAG